MSYDEEYPDEYEAVEEEVLVGDANGVLIRDRRSIAQTQGGLRRRRVGSRFLASCGHLIHSIEEVGGVCKHKNCNAIVCRDCLRACERCGKLLCPKHQKLHNGAVLCPTCKLIAVFFGFSPRSQEQVSPRTQRSITSSIFYNLFQRPWKAPPLYDFAYQVPDGRIKRRRNYG